MGDLRDRRRESPAVDDMEMHPGPAVEAEGRARHPHVCFRTPRTRLLGQRSCRNSQCKPSDGGCHGQLMLLWERIN